MTQIEAMIAEYDKTIQNLSARLANAAGHVQVLQTENDELKMKIVELSKTEVASG